MTKLDQLDAVMQRQNGILRTADIRALGVSRSYFAEYVKVRGLERVAHGVYLSPDSLGDDFFIIQSRWPQAVFSHEAPSIYGGWQSVSRCLSPLRSKLATMPPT